MKATATKFLAHVGFWLATLVLAATIWTLYDASIKGYESSRWVGHTQDVLQALADTSAAVSLSESAQGGYLLSGDEVFLGQRDTALVTLRAAVDRLRNLTLDNPLQQSRLIQLEKLIAARVEIMMQSVRLRQTQGLEAVRKRISSGVGQRANPDIYSMTALMAEEESSLLAGRRVEAALRHKSELNALIVAGLIGLLILVPCYLVFVLQIRAREQTETNSRVMADSLPGALYQLRQNPGSKPRLTFLSAGVEQVHGVSSATLPEWSSLVNAIDDRDRPGFMVAMAGATETLSAFRYDYRVKHIDGTERWLHHEGSVQKEEGGNLLQNGYVADITQQTRVNEVLQEATLAADSANRAKSTFLATMSHEIRTPMNGVLGMLELLSLTRLDGEQRTTLEIVRQSSKSLLRIIDDILDFSKIEAGKLEVRPEVVSIRDVIEDLHNIYSGNASSRGVLITRNVDPQISGAVRVDPLRLRQILTNFLSNALKFTLQGTVKIRVELIDRIDNHDRVRFMVVDSGIGISAENQQRLFQPFSQIDSDETRRVGGTGLGLTICRRLADMMGGSVEMISRPGVGTTMVLTLLLPIADENDLPRAAAPRAERDKLSSTANMRRMTPSIAQAEAEGTLVLLVDDHPTNRTLLMRQVQALGYAAESADDGREAFDKWRTGRYGLVITDCNMPEMDGYELARAIRKEESAQNAHANPAQAGNGATKPTGIHRTPIIACTANALGGEAEICFAAGMDDYLVKPVELAQILKKLDQWLPIPESAKPGITAPAPAGARSHAAPVDHSIVASIWGADEGTGRDVLAAFRQANDTDAAVLMRAIGTRDNLQVVYTAHRMLGASKWVGALQFAETCEAIEKASRGGDWDAVTLGLEGFQREWVRLNGYFDSL